jgi:phage terminase Nu1 subunit (DNA packaging protein)
LLSSLAIQDHTGISERTIRQWIADGVIPQTDDMGMVVKSVITYYKGQTAEARRDRTKEGQDELYVQKVRLTEAQADKLDLENREREGELVEADSVRSAWLEMIAAARAKLLSIPTKVAPQVIAMSNAADAEQLVKLFVYEALEELSTSLFDAEMSK